MLTILVWKTRLKVVCSSRGGRSAADWLFSLKFFVRCKTRHIKGRSRQFWSESENLEYPWGIHNPKKIQPRSPVVRKTPLSPAGKPSNWCTLGKPSKRCTLGKPSKRCTSWKSFHNIAREKCTVLGVFQKCTVLRVSQPEIKGYCHLG